MFVVDCYQGHKVIICTHIYIYIYIFFFWGGGGRVQNHIQTLASGARPDRGRPGSKPDLKAGVSTARGRALAGLAKG